MIKKCIFEQYIFHIWEFKKLTKNQWQEIRLKNTYIDLMLSVVMMMIVMTTSSTSSVCVVTMISLTLSSQYMLSLLVRFPCVLRKTAVKITCYVITCK